MGLAKKYLEDVDSQGYYSTDGSVCSCCINEPAVKRFVETNATLNECSYCQQSGVLAVNFDVLMALIVDSLHFEWGNPSIEGLPYESREGGWQVATVYNAWDLLYDEIGLDVVNERLQADIADAILNGEWCEKEPFSLSSDRVLFYGWDKFSKFVKNSARYVFYKASNEDYDENQHDEMNPVDILSSLGLIVKKLELFRNVKAGTDFKRIRIVDPLEYPRTAKELGSPPADKATVANRMSPVGIPMFYAAFDVETAVCETYESTAEEKQAACATFSNIRDFLLIDLSRCPDIPSLFDETRRSSRGEVRFLVDFIQDFTKPVERIDAAHIEYVPTQIVTEYFRHVFKYNDGRKIDGIIYPSSKNFESEAVVVFADSQQCIEQNEIDSHALLRLNAVEYFDPKEKVASNTTVLGNYLKNLKD